MPIPFRCVAVDLVTGKEEVLANGSLASALRATMAIPGVFAPVNAGEKVLADGGLLNNVPTDVVKAMGADIVIAVDIGTPLGIASVAEPGGRSNQSLSVMMLDNVRDNLRWRHLLSPPDTTAPLISRRPSDRRQGRARRRGEGLILQTWRGTTTLGSSSAHRKSRRAPSVAAGVPIGCR